MVREVRAGGKKRSTARETRQGFLNSPVGVIDAGGIIENATGSFLNNLVAWAPDLLKYKYIPLKDNALNNRMQLKQNWPVLCIDALGI